MPTELAVALTRKREAKAQTHAGVTLVLICFIACLIAIVLLFVDKSFAEAVELSGLY
jgi:hypothetical protein